MTLPPLPDKLIVVVFSITYENEEESKSTTHIEFNERINRTSSYNYKLLSIIIDKLTLIRFGNFSLLFIHLFEFCRRFQISNNREN